MSERTNIRCMEPFKEGGQWWSGVTWEEGRPGSQLSDTHQRLIDRGRSTHHEAKRGAERLASKVEAEAQPDAVVAERDAVRERLNAMKAERDEALARLEDCDGKRKIAEAEVGDLVRERSTMAAALKGAEAERDAARAEAERLSETMKAARESILAACEAAEVPPTASVEGAMANILDRLKAAVENLGRADLEERLAKAKEHVEELSGRLLLAEGIAKREREAAELHERLLTEANARADRLIGIVERLTGEPVDADDPPAPEGDRCPAGKLAEERSP